MFEPLSTTVGILLLSGYTRSGSAVSREAADVASAAAAIVAASERSEALFGRKAALLAALTQVADECALPGWDGEDALAVTPEALQRATEFIRAMPEGMTLPEISAAPDGSIVFDWALSKHRLFALSIGQTNRLAYAWLDGTDKGHGVTRFDGVTLPSRVFTGVQATLSHGTTPLRAA